MSQDPAPAEAAPKRDATATQVIEFDPQWALFWGDTIAISQLEIWLPYIRRSRYRYVVVSGIDEVRPGVARLLEGVSNVSLATPFESALVGLKHSRHLKGVIYLTTRPLNFRVVTTLPNSAHVWIGHGESEKSVNGPRTASLYDAVFVARSSAVDRFPPAIRSWVRGGACAIGAPIVEGCVRSPWPAPRPVRTILYAPTWEGRRTGADYSSLHELAPILQSAMPELRRRGVTLIFRPHPGTGRRDPEYTALVSDLYAAGARKPGPKAEDFAAADVLLSDVSGITAEFLFTEKPLIMPVTTIAARRGKDAQALANDYPWSYQWHVGEQDLLGLLDDLATSDPLRGQRAAEAKAMYRGHRDIDAAARTFDIALSCVHRRRGWPGIRLAFEAKLRSPLRLGLFGRVVGRGSRRASDATTPRSRRRRRRAPPE